MKEKVRNNLAKKATEDEFMKKTKHKQKDDLAFPRASPLTGGASSSQGPLPPKTPRTPKARVERRRSRDNDPKNLNLKQNQK